MPGTQFPMTGFPAAAGLTGTGGAAKGSDTLTDSLLAQLSELDRQRRKVLIEMQEVQATQEHLKEGLTTKKTELDALMIREEELKREVQQVSAESTQLAKRCRQLSSNIDRIQSEEPVLFHHADARAEAANKEFGVWTESSDYLSSLRKLWGGDTGVALLHLELKEVCADLEVLRAKELSCLRTHQRQAEAPGATNSTDGPSSLAKAAGTAADTNSLSQINDRNALMSAIPALEQGIASEEHALEAEAAQAERQIAALQRESSDYAERKRQLEKYISDVEASIGYVQGKTAGLQVILQKGRCTTCVGNEGQGQ